MTERTVRFDGGSPDDEKIARVVCHKLTHALGGPRQVMSLDFPQFKRLGGGSFGHVYECGGRAIKVATNGFLESFESVRTVVEKYGAKKNFVQVYAASEQQFRNKTNTTFVMELLVKDYRYISKYRQRQSLEPLFDFLKFCKGAAKNVELAIVLADLKLANIGCRTNPDGTETAVLCDFDGSFATTYPVSSTKHPVHDALKIGYHEPSSKKVFELHLLICIAIATFNAIARRKRFDTDTDLNPALFLSDGQKQPPEDRPEWASSIKIDVFTFLTDSDIRYITARIQTSLTLATSSKFESKVGDELKDMSNFGCDVLREAQKLLLTDEELAGAWMHMKAFCDA